MSAGAPLAARRRWWPWLLAGAVVIAVVVVAAARIIRFSLVGDAFVGEYSGAAPQPAGVPVGSPNASRSLRVSSREFKGRGAGVG